MVLPNLIHPVNVTIKRHDSSAQVFQGTEPMHGARSSASFTIQAQVKWLREDEQNMMEGGIRPRSDGYILIRRKDLQDAGVDIGEGDQISAIGWQTGLMLFVVRTEPIASYPDQDGPTLVKYHFQDRKPTAGTAQVQ